MFEKKNEKCDVSCESCIHYIVCGHKDYMKKAVEQVETIEIEKSEFVKIIVKCNKYREIVSAPRGGSSVQKTEI